MMCDIGSAITVPRPCHRKDVKGCKNSLDSSLLVLFTQFAHHAHSFCWHNEKITIARDTKELTEMLYSQQQEIENMQKRIREEQQRFSDQIHSNMVQLQLSTETATNELRQHSKTLEQVAAEGEHLHQTLGEAVGAMKGIEENYLKSVRSWIPTLVWYGIRVLEERTGWSQTSAVVLVVVMAIASAVVWCFKLDKQQKLLFVVMVTTTSSVLSYLQEIKVFLIQYQMEIYASAILLAVTAVTTIVWYFFMPTRPYQRIFLIDPRDEDIDNIETW
jgi:DNA-binding protein YbaB